MFLIGKYHGVIIGFFEERSASGLRVVISVFTLVSGPFRFFCLLRTHAAVSVRRRGHRVARDRRQPRELYRAGSGQSGTLHTGAALGG